MSLNGKFVFILARNVAVAVAVAVWNPCSHAGVESRAWRRSRKLHGYISTAIALYSYLKAYSSFRQAGRENGAQKQNKVAR